MGRRGLPLLASVDGRVLDSIVTPDGRHVPGEYFVYAMLDWPDVRQWQVVQTAPDAVFDAFCASRLGGDWGQAFGTLSARTDFDTILQRALPH